VISLYPEGERLAKLSDKTQITETKQINSTPAMKKKNINRQQRRKKKHLLTTSNEVFRDIVCFAFHGILLATALPALVPRPAQRRL